MAQLTSRRVGSERSIQPALMKMSAQQSTKASSMTSSPTCRGLQRNDENARSVSHAERDKRARRHGTHRVT